MKTLNTLICLSILFLISGCLPDSFTNWNLQPPSSDSSTESGATDGGPGGTNPPPPTSFTYTPSSPYAFNLTNDASATIPPLTPVSTGGGEIVEGFITFQLAGVTDVNGVATTTVWPNTLSIDPNTGIISGRPNQFINHNTYLIKATPLGFGPIYTNIEISMATRPGTIYYPQRTGQTLILEVSAPENFLAGNFVTSEKNAKGTVTSVDQNNKIIYVTVSCNTSTPCPIFQAQDKIDNKSSFFLEQSIVTKVVYGFTKTQGIQNMIPVTNPNISGEQPQYAISPDITVNSGVSFASSTGQISAAPDAITTDIPSTRYTVTVKNVIDQTANAILNLQVLEGTDTKSPDSVEYAYKPGVRVAVNPADGSFFQIGGRISNQNGTSGTVKDILNDGTISTLLMDIDSWSKSAFKPGQLVDNGYPYILAATALNNNEPSLVHQIETSFSAIPTLTGGLTANDLTSLTWTSTPALPHLCQSIASTPTIYYPEDTNIVGDPLSCENAHGTCSVSGVTNGAACVNATPTAGTWTSSAKFLTEYKDDLWFNRKTGKFGADNPQKTFPSQTFEVSVTSLTGVVVRTTTAFSFQDVPKNLSYSSDVLLEVDDFSEFDIGDQVTSDGNGVGVITYKFISSPPLVTPTYISTQQILVVRATSGQFLEGEDIDNVYPFTFQKGEIIKAKYNNLGIEVGFNINNFQMGDVVTSSTAKGIINYIESTSVSGVNTLNAIWVKLIDTTPPSSGSLNSFSTADPAITALPSGSSSTITGILGDNITVNQPTAADYTAGMDVSASPTFGFGMTNSGTNNVSISVESGQFSVGTVGNQLFRFNPSTSTAAEQRSNNINSVTYNPIFYLDRQGTTGIQPVVDSPPNNGVTYTINPALPKGLNFDTTTGQITTVDPGPVAAALKNYTVLASNFLGQTSFTFGLAVREVFSVTDITNQTGNLSGILHKSGQGYSRFPCRITQDQIKMKSTPLDTNTSNRAKNINCLYDVGEGELYQNGLQLNVNVGTDLCTYVEHVPYFFYQEQYQRTNPLATPQNMEHTGDWSNVSCGPGQPTGVPVQYPNGAPADQCIGNQSGLQCDDGSVPTIQRDYELVGVCYDSASTPVAGVTDLATCFGAPDGSDGRAFCSNPAETDRDNCLSTNNAWNSNSAFINNQCWSIQSAFADAAACLDNVGSCSVTVDATCTAGQPNCTNRTECNSISTPTVGIWTSNGRWVDSASCQSSAGVAGPNFACGGSQINCINGPGKDFLPDSALTGRFGNYLRGETIRVTEDPISFTYKAPTTLTNASGSPYQTNIYISNFSRLNQCTPFNGTPYEFNMSTWFNVGKLQDPQTQGTDAPFAGGNGVYAIRCLDGSANIIGQINILIREWDFDFKAKDGTDIIDLTGAPVDGSSTVEDEFGYPENTYEDWDNKPMGGTCAVPLYDYPADNL